MQIDSLISEIEAAFQNVQLGHGTSIHEAREIDYRSSKEKRLKARKKDAETAWQAVPAESLSRNEKYICFLDAEGMRFYLPALMSWYLRSDGSIGGEELILPLCIGESSSDFERKFSLLNGKQSHAVAAFLKYVAATDDYNSEDIEIAFARYWNKYA